MFLENWYKALAAEMYNHESVTGVNTTGLASRFVSSSGSGSCWTTTSLMLAGGTSSSAGQYTYEPHMGLVRTSYNFGGVVFGTGSVEPKFDDHKLSGDLITTISAACSVSPTLDDGGCTFTGMYTLTNTGSEEIIIGEVGLIMNSPYSGTFLIERTVLDSPVTIPAGGIGQVTYTIRFNYPTA